MIGHHSSYLGRRIQRVWWPRRKSFDNVAVHGSVTMRDFIIIRWMNNEFGCDSVPIHLLRWIDSMCIECSSPKTGFKCEHDECAFDAHWIHFLGLVWKGLYWHSLQQFHNIVIERVTFCKTDTWLPCILKNAVVTAHMVVLIDITQHQFKSWPLFSSWPLLHVSSWY